LGEVHYGLTQEESKSRVFRRSLFVVQDVRKGEVLGQENIRSIRPANGLSPKYMAIISGRTARKDIKRGTPLNWDLVD
jgi:sialic acid synthase SpsE